MAAMACTLTHAAGEDAETAVSESRPDKGAITLEKGDIHVDLTLDLRQQKVKSEQAVVYTPMLAAGGDSIALPAIGVYGRARYIRHERGNDGDMTVPPVIFKASRAPKAYAYHAQLPYTPALEGAELVVSRKIYGCAACAKGEDKYPTGIAMLTEPKIDYSDSYMTAVVKMDTMKIRELSGRANVEFQVNRTVLLPDFRNNAEELASVRASIDSVRDDKDVTIKMIKITGYASPEGSYANNERLADGRTEALREYVENYYKFPASLVQTAWIAEDWDGLRERVQKSDMMVRDDILRVIDDPSLAPDAKDARLKKLFPQEYAYILKNIYPSLRHTDYRIEYVVRVYSDPKEILEVMRTRPDHLSLGEFCFAAKDMDPASDEYAEVMQIAVRTYPDEPAANLNAANVALRRGDTEAAEKYLAKAGDSAQATHSRGVYALMTGDLDNAVRLLKSSAASGVPQSQGMLEQAEKLRDYRSKVAK